MTRSRSIRSAAIALVAIHVAVLMAGFLAPYNPTAMYRNYPYAPPARLHFYDDSGHFHFPPFVYALVPEEGSAVYGEDHSQSYQLRFFVRVPGTPVGLIPIRWRLFDVERPGVCFLLGSDGYGRDVLSRLLYGAQVSLFTGLLAAAISLAIAWTLGGLAGYFGGWLDAVLMRSGELFMALPWLYLLLGVRAFLPLHIEPVAAFGLVIGIIAAVGWVRPARLIRGVVLSARERPYVQAARGFGASHFYLLWRHILPETGSVLVTQATVLIPRYILAEVTLSFLGLGIAEPIPSWGNMLADARQYHSLVLHTWMLTPALAATGVLLCYLLLADAMLEAREV